MSDKSQPMTFVAAVRHFFSDRKVEMEEFKNLTREDKVELRDMLNGAGYEVLPLGTPPPKQ